MKLESFKEYDIKLSEDVEDDYYDDRNDYDEDDHDWEEETWYAMTGGQYGDYPGKGVDYDFLGY